MSKRTGTLHPLATMTPTEAQQVMDQLAAEGLGYRPGRSTREQAKATARALVILAAIRNGH